jgi:NAD(P)-dependent dehydrogenase (short-subunit alcohol dehydrogenase family)
MDADSPFGRVCQPEDVANAVLFFCSPQASYLTGQRIQVNGGGNSLRVGQ